MEARSNATADSAAEGVRAEIFISNSPDEVFSTRRECTPWGLLRGLGSSFKAQRPKSCTRNIGLSSEFGQLVGGEGRSPGDLTGVESCADLGLTACFFRGKLRLK